MNIVMVLFKASSNGTKGAADNGQDEVNDDVHNESGVPWWWIIVGVVVFVVVLIAVLYIIFCGCKKKKNHQQKNSREMAPKAPPSLAQTNGATIQTVPSDSTTNPPTVVGGPLGRTSGTPPRAIRTYPAPSPPSPSRFRSPDPKPATIVHEPAKTAAKEVQHHHQQPVGHGHHPHNAHGHPHQAHDHHQHHRQQHVMPQKMSTPKDGGLYEPEDSNYINLTQPTFIYSKKHVNKKDSTNVNK